MIERKRWRDLAQTGEWFHLARFRFLPGRRAQLHTHDFPEVFWVESGRARHSIQGHDKRLDAGDLVFVRARDRHVLSAADADGFTLVNLAFDPRVLADLLARHGKEIARFHDQRAPLPARFRLNPEQVTFLRRELSVLTRNSHRRLALEKFLLEIYTLFEPVPATHATALPSWLARACEKIHEAEYFAQGAAGLVQAAGRCPEHVARVVREHFDCTPTDLVNRTRMEFAARELRLGSRPITAIALECGIEDLSHFYTLFRRAYNRTPRQYRLSYQMALPLTAPASPGENRAPNAPAAGAKARPRRSRTAALSR